MRVPSFWLVRLGALCVAFAGGATLWSQQLPELRMHFPAPTLNAPYTAQRVTTTYQKLADGTQITHERVEFVARDGLGRTVKQVELKSSGSQQSKDRKFSTWTVSDPVTLTETHWCDCNHLATVMHFDSPLTPRGRPFNEALIGRAPGLGAGVNIGPLHASMHYQLEPLPAQDLMGVHTEGTKAVRTLPAGKDGNDHDLTWTIQSWYSPELKLALFIIVDDPTRGITKYEYKHLERVEPEPSRFVVPTDYQMKELALPHGLVSLPSTPSPTN